MRAIVFAFFAAVVCLTVRAEAQESARVRIVPEADDLWMHLLVDRPLLDASEPLICSWDVRIGTQRATWTQEFDSAVDAEDLGGVCVVRASDLDPPLAWPDSGTLSVSSTLVIGGANVPVAPVEIVVDAAAVSSTRAIIDALQAIGGEVIVERDAGTYRGLNLYYEGTVELGEQALGLDIVVGQVSAEPADLCLCTQEECTVCGSNHAVTVYAGESAERLLVIDALRSVLE